MPTIYQPSAMPATFHSHPFQHTAPPHTPSLATCTPAELHAHLLHLNIPAADADLLLHEDVDGPSIPPLTHPHLQAMGVPTYGRRQHILTALNPPTSTSPSSSPPPLPFQPAWKPPASPTPSSPDKPQGFLSHFHLPRPHSASPVLPHPAAAPAPAHPYSAHPPPRPHSALSHGTLPAHYPPSFASPLQASPHYSPVPSLPTTPADPTQPLLHSHSHPHYAPLPTPTPPDSSRDYIAAYPSPPHPRPASAKDTRSLLRQQRAEADLRYEEERDERRREQREVQRLQEELQRREHARHPRVEEEEKVPTPPRHHRRALSEEEEEEVVGGPARPFPRQPAVVKAATVAPLLPSPPPLTPPPHRLQLEWVYGYNASSATSRSTIVVTPNALLYPASNVVVIHHTPHTAHTPSTQSHFTRHEGTVITLAAHPHTAGVIASASAHPPQLLVWDVGGVHLLPLVMPLVAADVGVKGVGWSSCGRCLASLSQDGESTLRLWDWAEGKAAAAVHTGRGEEGAERVEWNPTDPAQLVTVGKRHLVFWQWKGGRVKGQKAALPPHPVPALLALTFSAKGYACVGTGDGGVLVYTSAHAAARRFEVGKGPVLAMAGGVGGLVVGMGAGGSGGEGGSGGGRVVVLTRGMERVREVALGGGARVRVVAVGKGGEVVVGTRDGSVWRLEGDAWAEGWEEGKEVRRVVEGHSDGELTGVAVGWDGGVVTVAGDDVLMWDVEGKRVERRARVTEGRGVTKGGGATAVAVGREGVLVGSMDGDVVHFSPTLRVLHRIPLPSLLPSTPSAGLHPTALALSPDGHLLAVGTSAGVLVVLAMHGSAPASVMGAVTALAHAVVRVEWKGDGRSVHVSDERGGSVWVGRERGGGEGGGRGGEEGRGGGGWEVVRGGEGVGLEVGGVVEVSSPVGWGVRALFREGGGKGVRDGVVAVKQGRGGAEGLVVVGGLGDGGLRLYRWTGLCVAGQQWRQEKAHVGRVGGVRWLSDKRLLSIGRDDLCLLQWKLL